MSKILYVSYDDGTLYTEDEVDKPINGKYYWPIEVPNEIILTPEQICGCHGSIVEVLSRAKIARKVF